MINSYISYLILLIFYIISCLWVIIRYYKKEQGVFQAPFIFSLASMLMMVPQFSTIIFNPYYDPDLLWDLTYCMITSTLAFSFGWEKAQSRKIYACYDINLKRSKIVFFLLFIVGLYCAIQSYSQVLTHFSSGSGDIRDNHKYQVLLFFMIYFDIGMFYALTYIIKNQKAKHSKLVYAILIISSIYYIYIILMLARRALVVKIFMSLALLVSMTKPRLKNKIKILVILVFTFGTIYQASISTIRSNLHGNLTGNNNDKEQIDIWGNYKKSYYAPDLTRGMDLGNAALFIKYTKEHNTYNCGLFFWNDIVTWYFPSFIFGDKGKESLKVANDNEKYINSITQGVTTQTGYYQAFSAFGYLGFILFYGLGYILGYIWRRIYVSSLYLIVYLSFMFNIPNIASHGFSYVIGQIETFIIFCVPLIMSYIYKKRILYNKPKLTNR